MPDGPYRIHTEEQASEFFADTAQALILVDGSPTLVWRDDNGDWWGLRPANEDDQADGPVEYVWGDIAELPIVVLWHDAMAYPTATLRAVETVRIDLPAGFELTRHLGAVEKKVTDTHGEGFQIISFDAKTGMAVAERRADVVQEVAVPPRARLGQASREALAKAAYAVLLDSDNLTTVDGSPSSTAYHVVDAVIARAGIA